MDGNISDKTFAIRLLSFLSFEYPYNRSSFVLEEEYDYLVFKACELLRIQIDRCPESDRWYFENMVKDFTYEKIIKEHICKTKPEFLKYLQLLKLV